MSELEVPSEWEALDEEADAALTAIATSARDAIGAAGEDADAARAALWTFYRGWMGLAKDYPATQDTDVRECVGSFFDELAEFSPCDLDARVVWGECAFGLLDGRPIPTVASALDDASAVEPLVEAIAAALQPGPAELPGLGTLQVRYRAAIPGERFNSPVDRMRALAEGRQVGMPAQLWFRFKPTAGLKERLADPAGAAEGLALDDDPLAAAVGAEALRTVVTTILAGLPEDRARIELGGALVFARRDRKGGKARNPLTGAEITIPAKVAVNVHVRRGLRERVAARFEAEG